MIPREVDSAAQAAMYGGSGGAVVVWGLQLSELAAIISAGVAILGFLVHLWATVRKDRRAEEAHRAELEALKRGATVVVGERAEEDGAAA